MWAGRSVFDYYSSPVWHGEHPPLVLGWGEEQLRPIVELLRPLLPEGLTPKMECAVAACARSLVVESRLSGRRVRYSRAKEHYRIPERYRQRGRYYSSHFVPKSMDLLIEVGLIGHALGEWQAGGGGRQSVAWALDELRELLDPVINVNEPREWAHQLEVIVLRDGEDKKDVDYVDTDQIETMRAQMQTVNEHLAQLDLQREGTRFPITLARRVFNGDFSRGGRLYCLGTSFQIIPVEERRSLELMIGGEMHPLVEIDYSNLHVSMAYAEAGLPVPPGDLYDIEGFDRGLVKLAVNVLLNASTTQKAISALTEDLKVNARLREASGIPYGWRTICRPEAIQVAEAIQERHQEISAAFGSDSWARFQRRDSDMAIQVISRMIQRTGRCPLPMHDSFLVAWIDRDVLAETMREVAAEEGLHLCLKESGWSPPPGSSIPLPLSIRG